MKEIKEEAKDALKYPHIDIARNINIDISLISIADGNWVRGWNNSPLWLNYGLIYAGHILANAKIRQPKTIEFLVGLNKPIIMAGYSLLKPGGKIELHTDEKIANNKENVWHIGLDVPDNCSLIIKDKKFLEKNMQLISFDDSLVHGAENLSNKDRMILYIKFDT